MSLCSTPRSAKVRAAVGFVESSGASPAETARIVMRGPGRVELYSGCASSGVRPLSASGTRLGQRALSRRHRCLLFAKGIAARLDPKRTPCPIH